MEEAPFTHYARRVLLGFYALAFLQDAATDGGASSLFAWTQVAGHTGGTVAQVVCFVSLLTVAFWPHKRCAAYIFMGIATANGIFAYAGGVIAAEPSILNPNTGWVFMNWLISAFVVMVATGSKPPKEVGL